MGRVIEIPGEAAPTWRAGVAAEASLPASGNNLYDCRVALSEEAIYFWNGSAWVAVGGGGGGAVWGAITGTLADQTDLQTALDAKLATAAFTAAAVTGKLITGYTSGAGTVAATDTILEAIQKLNGNSVLKANSASPTFTGTMTQPDGSTWDSSTLTFPNTKRITFGTATFGNENNTSNRVSVRVATGGRFEGIENGEQLFTILADAANWGAFALGRDWAMKWQMGKGTSHYGFGRVRGYCNITPGSSSTTEADLQSKTVQANELPNDGECLSIEAYGTTGANGNAKVIRLYVGGTAIGTINTSANAKTWFISARVFRTGSSAEKYVVIMNIDGTVTIVNGTLAVATSGTIIVKTTGEEVVTGEALTIDYDRAAN